MKDYLSNTSEDGTIDTEKVPLEYLDLRLGNLCNLKCRICSPSESSLWIDDFAELQRQQNNVVELIYYGSQTYPLRQRLGNRFG